MSTELTVEQLMRLTKALDRLNTIKSELGVDVCAYGDIDIQIDGGNYLRLGISGGDYYVGERWT